MTEVRRRRLRNRRRHTYTVHVDTPLMAALDSLVDDGVYLNRSHAVEEAIRRLLAAPGNGYVPAAEVEPEASGVE